jgi:hypothetical protein
MGCQRLTFACSGAAEGVQGRVGAGPGLGWGVGVLPGAGRGGGVGIGDTSLGPRQLVTVNTAIRRQTTKNCVFDCLIIIGFHE